MLSPSSSLCASSAERNGTAFNVQSDFPIIMRLAQILRFPLECEKQSLEKGDHCDYRTALRIARQRFGHRMEQIQIEEMEEKGRIQKEYEEEIRLLEQEYAKKLRELEESFFKENDEQKRSLDNEINTLDIGSPPPVGSGEGLLGSGANQNPQVHGQQHQNVPNALHAPTTAISGKKFLRSRQNESTFPSPSSAESVAHLGAVGMSIMDGVSAVSGVKRRTQTMKSGSPFGFLGFGSLGDTFGGFAGAIGGMAISSLTIPYLLSESAISEDIHLLGSDSTYNGQPAERSSLGVVSGQDGGGLVEGVALSGNSWHSAGGEMADEEVGERTTASASGRHHRRVLLEQNKMILDGKTFHRFQTVFIELVSSGRMPATVRSISEGRYVEFRSGIPGDTRTFTATKDDLESGRAFVRKRY